MVLPTTPHNMVHSSPFLLLQAMHRPLWQRSSAKGGRRGRGGRDVGQGQRHHCYTAARSQIPTSVYNVVKTLTSHDLLCVYSLRRRKYFFGYLASLNLCQEQ